MSIDISSMIPVINIADIRVNKEESAQRVRPVEKSNESENSGPQLNREDSPDVIRDNLSGVGDTYSDRGELIREANPRQNSDDKNMTIDMFI
ncbi:MAG: hypothetical protein JW944_13600 [Deltaproteobacteria bacterium]|nr:hypothetical protein [Deltaproteobacteria bacterium]